MKGLISFWCTWLSAKTSMNRRSENGKHWGVFWWSLTFLKVSLSAFQLHHCVGSDFPSWLKTSQVFYGDWSLLSNILVSSFALLGWIWNGRLPKWVMEQDPVNLGMLNNGWYAICKDYPERVDSPRCCQCWGTSAVLPSSRCQYWSSSPYHMKIQGDTWVNSTTR